MKVFNVVNSFIGKKGNIGLRTAYILAELACHSQVASYSFARGHDPNWKKQNHQSNVIKRHKHMGISGNLPRLLNAYRIYLHRNFNHRYFDLQWFNLFFFIRERSFFAKRIDSGSVVHLWDYSPDIINFCRKRQATVLLDVPIAPSATLKKIREQYGAQTGLTYFKSLEKIEKKCFQRADGIIAPSLFVKEELILLDDSLANKINVVPFGSNGCKDEQSSVVHQQKSFQSKPKSGIDFCFLGNVNFRKGIGVLLQAWQHPDFAEDRLHLCGRVFPEVKKALDNLNGRYRKNIILPGFIDPSTYLSMADVYVFPSFMEGSAKSVYEAMAMGLAVIATRQSGSVITNGKEGFLCEAGNSVQLQQKMLELKKNKALRLKMGSTAKQTASHYTWKNYAKMVMDLYSAYK